MASRNRRTPLAVVLIAALLAGCTAATTTEPDPSPSVAERLRSDVAEYLRDRGVLDRDVRAVVVTVGGDPLLELYRDSDPDDYYNVASVTKSIVSTLVGFAVDDGLLDVDSPLEELLPQHASTMTPDVAATTLHQLLTMTGPFPGTWRTGGGAGVEDPDWVAANLASANRRPGDFAYSDPGVDVVAAVLAQATGTTLVQYGREKLFDPLGIDTTPAFEPLAAEENVPAYVAAGFAWPVDPQGIHLGSGLLKLRAQDLVRVGQLYLDHGEWEGRQILSEEWVESATTAQVDAFGAADDYGYLWWVDETDDGYDTFLAWGFAGQLLQVVPELGIVAVVQTEYELGTGAGVAPRALIPLVDQVIVPAVRASVTDT